MKINKSLILKIMCYIFLFGIGYLIAKYYSLTNENARLKQENLDYQTELNNYKYDGLEIKPCPFCGSSDLVVIDLYGNGNDCHVKCNNCGSTGSSHDPDSNDYDLDKTQAIELWNNRIE